MQNCSNGGVNKGRAPSAQVAAIQTQQPLFDSWLDIFEDIATGIHQMSGGLQPSCLSFPAQLFLDAPILAVQVPRWADGSSALLMCKNNLKFTLIFPAPASSALQCPCFMGAAWTTQTKIGLLQMSFCRLFFIALTSTRNFLFYRSLIALAVGILRAGIKSVSCTPRDRACSQGLFGGINR